MQEGDEYLSMGLWYKFNVYNYGCDFFEHAHYEKGRRPLPAATFEESANFEPEFIIGKEPVDKVIYPKAEQHWMDAKGHDSVAPIFKSAIRTLEHLSYEHLGGGQWKPPIGKPPKPIRNKYSREIAPGVFVDVYDVLKAFDVTNSALQHLIKKALAVGIRGHKDADEDYQDIIDSAIRAKELG